MNVKALIEQPKQAIMWAAILTAAPFLRWFGILLMLLVTLRQGWREGLILAVVVAVINATVFGVVWRLKLDQLVFQVIDPFVLFLLAYRLRVSASWLDVTQCLTTLAVLAVVVIHVCFPQLANAWSVALVEILKQGMADKPEFAQVLTEANLQIMASVAVGLRVVLMMVLSLLSLMVARYIQASLYNPGGLRQELHAWRLNVITGLVLTILIVVCSLTKASIAPSVVLVLSIPFVCTGITLLHTLVACFTWELPLPWKTDPQRAQRAFQLVFLWLFYIAMFTQVPYLLIGLMLLGWVDAFINFRKRFVFKR